MELFLPRVREPALLLPSYVKLDMAFGVGAGSTLFDKSRYRSHGAITGAAWAAGLHGYALDFIPATPSYVKIPAASSTQLDFTSDAFSIVARCYFDDLSGTIVLLMRGQEDVGGYVVMFTTQYPQLFTYQAGASQQTRSADAVLSESTWHTIGWSRSGAGVLIYVDGVAVDLVAGTHIDPVSSGRDTLIGIWHGLGLYPMDGKIEFLRVFGGIALSASAHLAWHNALA